DGRITRRRCVASAKTLSCSTTLFTPSDSSHSLNAHSKPRTKQRGLNSHEENTCTLHVDHGRRHVSSLARRCQTQPVWSLYRVAQSRGGQGGRRSQGICG